MPIAGYIFRKEEANKMLLFIFLIQQTAQIIGKLKFKKRMKPNE
jgi:hypothetical protein